MFGKQLQELIKMPCWLEWWMVVHTTAWVHQAIEWSGHWVYETISITANKPRHGEHPCCNRNQLVTDIENSLQLCSTVRTWCRLSTERNQSSMLSALNHTEPPCEWLPQAEDRLHCWKNILKGFHLLSSAWIKDTFIMSCLILNHIYEASSLK